MGFLNPVVFAVFAIGVVTLGIGLVLGWFELNAVRCFKPRWYSVGFRLLKGRVRYDEQFDAANALGGIFVTKTGLAKKTDDDQLLLRSRSDSLLANCFQLKTSVVLVDGRGEVTGRMSVASIVLMVGFALAAGAFSIVEIGGGGLSGSWLGPLQIVALFIVVVGFVYSYIVTETSKSRTKELRKVKPE